MKQLKIKRLCKNKVTAILSYIDWWSVPEEGPHDGCFPEIHEYWQFDSIEEFIKECRDEYSDICVDEVEVLYVGLKDITDNFLAWRDSGMKLKLVED